MSESTAESVESTVEAPELYETVASKRQRLCDAQVPIAEAEALFDAVCQTYFRRSLHQHERIRQRVLSLLLEPDGLGWAWSLVCHHCGLTAGFLERALDALLRDVDVASVTAPAAGTEDDDTP
jgi:hypothetical protein